ncbi:cleavage and polyadenylation specifity factor protein [Cardiosporidium cionae]|uniref:Cleavage and polyadenylation specifity factor protein n=1 Tax=Cardiosporidium cionae TaxID=476202 RepID=A0ABQ7JF36_9APIC|nr:cleavage and polyadenylation specifity factor protein [Cardiosporidium cionae]|eukprot:KAF8822631.1 cleavage and polyadenylation specifity factor protein [Cardiosporidium cionae]
MTENNKKRCRVRKGGTLQVVPLGAGCEVGRSCVVVSYNGYSVMLDCGIHPAYTGIGALPMFDAFDVHNIDLCLVTHFHLDHCGAVPYFLTKTAFQGRLFMTEPTLAICKLLWSDYCKMTAGNQLSVTNFSPKNSSYVDSASYHSNVLFDDADVEKALKKCSIIDFNQEIEYEGIKFTCYRAGHVLGACMFLVEIAGVRFLYTGDYSREIDRHIPPAEIPPVDVHVLICESTYGIRVHDERKQREQRLLRAIQEIVKRNGKCLLPVFALGRAQELLFILEEFWNQNVDLQKVPLLNISSMSGKSMLIYETFINMCGDDIKKRADEGKNPFQFKYVRTVRSIDSMKSYMRHDGPCVVMAAPGMLQNGPSRELFEAWAPDSRNGVILTGYAVKGTLADELKREPKTIELSDRILKRHCSFEQISFSAHADFNQTQAFIEGLKAPNVILVHGERGEMMRLKEKLVAERPALSVFTPEILQSLCLNFDSDNCLRIAGTLAEEVRKCFCETNSIDLVKLPTPQSDTSSNNDNGQNSDIADSQKINKLSSQCASPTLSIEGVLVTDKNNEAILLHANDVREYTHLEPTIIQQRMRIKYHGPFTTLKACLMELYEAVESISPFSICIDQRVFVTAKMETLEIIIEWQENPLSDLIADSVCFLILELSRGLISHPAQLSCKSLQSEEMLAHMLSCFFQEQYNSVIKIGRADCLLPCISNEKVTSDIILKFSTRDITISGKKTNVPVEININKREVSCPNHNIESSIRERLRYIEGSLFPLNLRTFG